MRRQKSLYNFFGLNVLSIHKSRQLPWKRGVLVIFSANGTEDRGFESRLGVTFLGHYKFVLCNLYMAWLLCVLGRLK
jgi:hypothetical protein